MIRDWALKVYLDDKRSEKGKSMCPRVVAGAGSEGLSQGNNREPFLYKRNEYSPSEIRFQKRQREFLLEFGVTPPSCPTEGFLTVFGSHRNK